MYCKIISSVKENTTIRIPGSFIVFLFHLNIFFFFVSPSSPFQYNIIYKYFHATKTDIYCWYGDGGANIDIFQADSRARHQPAAHITPSGVGGLGWHARSRLILIYETRKLGLKVIPLTVIFNIV